METLKIAGRMIAFEWHGAGGKDDPVLVFLHEGLGSISLWRDFPRKTADAMKCRVLVYDRYGHGRSDILGAPRTTAYLHEEAFAALPELLNALGVHAPYLIGHSDGASIALMYAAKHAASGVVAVAPHVFIEDYCVAAIRQVAQKFETGDGLQKLARHHADAEKMFRGWADIWLSDEFRKWDIRHELLPSITAPVLAIQGFEDEFNTMLQLDELASHAKIPVEQLRLHNCGHSPFRDCPDETLKAIVSFVSRHPPRGALRDSPQA